MIQVNNVVKSFDGFRALDGLTMSVEGGSIYINNRIDKLSDNS